MPQSILWGFDGEKDIIYLIDVIEQCFKLFGNVVVDFDSGGVSKPRSVDDFDVEFVLNIIDIVYCYLWGFALSGWLLI